jgi:ParB family chromosome partitioning protein
LVQNIDKRIETWDITQLKPHPKQGKYFSATPQMLQELAEDLKRNGLLQPVEALPDGTLIAGHKRVAAAKLLGWTTITVWVRDDLAQDPAAAERRLIEDNLNRGQLGPLATARCYRGLKELDRKRAGEALPDFERKELRDRIGQRLGFSGRTLDRYLRVLEGTPLEVQNAVEAGTLAMTVAEKVAGLKGPQREEIARLIRKGVEPKQAAAQFLGKKEARHKLPRGAKTAFVKSVERGLADLEGRVAQVRWVTPAEQETLARGQQLVAQLLEQAKRQPEVQPSILELLGIAEEDETDAGEQAGDAPDDPGSSPDKLAGAEGEEVTSKAS